MPALQMSQPVVGVVLGVVVLDETLNTSRAGMIALEVAVLVMAAAIFQLARVEAVSTRDSVEENVDAVNSPR
jgi:F0F1-type ATP synthase assembly protein I